MKHMSNDKWARGKDEPGKKKKKKKAQQKR